MGHLYKVNHQGKEITVEKVDADEIREMARENHGTFDDDFGVYFFASTSENNLPSRETMRSPHHANCHIGRGGVVRSTLKDPNTGKEIFSGAELCDLVVMPAHRRQGYGLFLTQLRLDWLKEKGYTEAFFPDCDEPGPITCLFERLQREGRLRFEKMYEITKSEGTIKSVYRVSNF